ncbi:alpha-amylase family glycosyl hydrolase [Aquibacillus sediminis]|uniref:alpha-amylase family glycosyl hydrolase n=1 Tax=Aquibacillus sediminis TaxID=2574734 RepID=UPI0011090D72|nr:alpha-amylase family glycosyl hydrolase [Aquibacillus sediminis]
MRKISIVLISFILLFTSGHSLIAQSSENAREEIVYYIMIDRFVNGSADNDYDVNVEDENAYHGGDIQGIISKLNYIKERGFTTINLSPFMSNEADGYHGFLIDDYRTMENHFGTIEDVQALVEKAHEMDLKVITDFVVTHVSPEHSWVTEQENWIAGETSNRWGEQLPVPNLENENVRQYLLETAIDWMEKTGIDGYRLHVNHDTPTDFIDQFSEQIQSQKPNSYLMVDGNDHGAPVSEGIITLDDRLYEQMTEVLSSAGHSLEPLFEQWQTSTDQMKGIYIDDHQTPRFTREAVNQEGNPITRWKLALTFMYMTPGTPIVYQGSEIPMDNGTSTPDHRMAQLNSGDDDLKQYYEKLATIREQLPVITEGELQYIDSNGAMSLFKLSNDDEMVYVAINNDEETKTITTKDIETGMQLNGLLQDNIVRAHEDGEFHIALDRETAEIFTVSGDTGLNWWFISFVVIVLGGFVVGVNYLSIKNKRKEQ